MWNVKEGINDIQFTLYYTDGLKVVPNKKDQPATAALRTDGSETSFTLDAEKHALQYSFHCDEPVQAEGLLFRIEFELPADAKPDDKYVFKPEVQKLSGASGDIAYKVLDGYVSILGSHDDLCFEKGDMNLSHYVDIDDVQLLLKEYVTTLSGRPSALRDDHRRIADVDEDGKVNVVDVLLLLKYYTERTALKEVTWSDMLGKAPEYPDVHISNETYDSWRQSEREGF